jgi:hypothetical protein
MDVPVMVAPASRLRGCLLWIQLSCKKLDSEEKRSCAVALSALPRGTAVLLQDNVIAAYAECKRVGIQVDRCKWLYARLTVRLTVHSTVRLFLVFDHSNAIAARYTADADRCVIRRIETAPFGKATSAGRSEGQSETHE